MKFTQSKKGFRILATVVVMLFAGFSLYAQRTAVSGIVKEASTGEPILGAGVIEKGTTNGTMTDINGQFTLNVLPQATLEVRFVGFGTKEVAVNGQTSF
ncbi:MAG: carboxypeptidase-like regulatory domain-containing protein, partial [Prevotellaceae bacterium]|nr:carboxypeptidase-like regulatory domain-containing protein [Prevotellaceae bacterium]